MNWAGYDNWRQLAGKNKKISVGEGALEVFWGDFGAKTIKRF